MREIIQRERKIELACEGSLLLGQPPLENSPERAESSDTRVGMSMPKRSWKLLYFDYGL